MSRKRIEAIFARAIGIEDESARETYIKRACREDLDLDQEVRSLLAAYYRPGEFLRMGQSLMDQAPSHFEHMEKLSEGGMGIIYKAKDTRLNRWVALKALPAWRAANPAARGRLVEEARRAAALNHPHIVTIYDLFQTNGMDVIVMEYIDGRPLHQLIPPRGMGVRAALHYGLQIADALASAHENGILHGDLSPANILITERDDVKLLDFGLARLVAGADGHTLPSAGGTPGFVAPERRAGHDLDHRSDIFSFGAVLYQMLAGRCPGPKAPRESARAIHDGLPPQVPSELTELIDRCLAERPEERWENMRDVMALLKEMATRAPEASRQKSRTSTRPLSFAAAAVGLAILMSLSWVLFTRHGRAPDATASDLATSPPTLQATFMTTPGPTERAYDEGIAFMRAHKYEQAKAQFDRVLHSDRGNIQARQDRAVCLQNLQRWDEAIADFTEVLRRRPKDYLALYDRAMAYMNLYRLPPALADLTAAINIHPSRHAYLNRAKVRINLGDLAGAADDERRAKEFKDTP